MKAVVYLFLSMSLFFYQGAHAQGRKTIAEYKIKKVTVYEEIVEQGKKEIIESVTVYNEQGNVVEEKEYNKEGVLKKHLKYTLDDKQRKIKEEHLDDKGKTIKYFEYKYDGEFRTERTEYDSKGKLVARKRYVYEKR